MERHFLQIAFAIAGLVLVDFGLAGVFFGELIVAPWLWQRHAASAARRNALT